MEIVEVAKVEVAVEIAKVEVAVEIADVEVAAVAMAVVAMPEDEEEDEETFIPK